MNANRLALQKRFKFICAQGVGVPLRPLGFKRSGNRYVKWIGEDFCFVVSPHRNKITWPDKSSFTIECYVFNAAEWRVYSEYPNSIRRGIGMTISVRISEICFDRGDKWWKLTSEDPPETDAAIIEDIRTRLESCVVPWFDQFRTVGDIGDYMSAPEYGPGRARFGYREIVQEAGNLRSAAIAYYAAGDYARVRKMLDMAERTVSIPESKAMTADLKRRLETLMEQSLGKES